MSYIFPSLQYKSELFFEIFIALHNPIVHFAINEENSIVVGASTCSTVVTNSSSKFSASVSLIAFVNKPHVLAISADISDSSSSSSSSEHSLSLDSVSFAISFPDSTFKDSSVLVSIPTASARLASLHNLEAVFDSTTLGSSIGVWSSSLSVAKRVSRLELAIVFRRDHLLSLGESSSSTSLDSASELSLAYSLAELSDSE
mmetsp:Transcript_19232/g.27641  ORF Transcript_19232/g.27641 Transcript_19232/m.27641 type:complete len:201 (-) Transcript_19232:1167-1769(-)